MPIYFTQSILHTYPCCISDTAADFDRNADCVAVVAVILRGIAPYVVLQHNAPAWGRQDDMRILHGGNWAGCSVCLGHSSLLDEQVDPCLYELVA